MEVEDEAIRRELEAQHQAIYGDAGTGTEVDDMEDETMRDIVSAGDVHIYETTPGPQGASNATPAPPAAQQPSLASKALPWVLAAAGIGTSAGLYLSQGDTDTDTDTRYELRLDADGSP